MSATEQSRLKSRREGRREKERLQEAERELLAADNRERRTPAQKKWRLACWLWPQG